MTGYTYLLGLYDALKNLPKEATIETDEFAFHITHSSGSNYDQSAHVKWQFTPNVEIEVLNRHFHIPKNEPHFRVPEPYWAAAQGNEALVFVNGVKFGPVKSVKELPVKLRGPVAGSLAKLMLVLEKDKPQDKRRVDPALQKEVLALLPHKTKTSVPDRLETKQQGDDHNAM